MVAETLKLLKTVPFSQRWWTDSWLLLVKDDCWWSKSCLGFHPWQDQENRKTQIGQPQRRVCIEVGLGAEIQMLLRHVSLPTVLHYRIFASQGFCNFCNLKENNKSQHSQYSLHVCKGKLQGSQYQSKYKSSNYRYDKRDNLPALSLSPLILQLWMPQYGKSSDAAINSLPSLGRFYWRNVSACWKKLRYGSLCCTMIQLWQEMSKSSKIAKEFLQALEPGL